MADRLKSPAGAQTWFGTTSAAPQSGDYSVCTRLNEVPRLICASVWGAVCIAANFQGHSLGSGEGGGGEGVLGARDCTELRR